MMTCFQRQCPEAIQIAMVGMQGEGKRIMTAEGMAGVPKLNTHKGEPPSIRTSISESCRLASKDHMVEDDLEFIFGDASEEINQGVVHGVPCPGVLQHHGPSVPIGPLLSRSRWLGSDEGSIVGNADVQAAEAWHQTGRRTLRILFRSRWRRWKVASATSKSASTQFALVNSNRRVPWSHTHY